MTTTYFILDHVKVRPAKTSSKIRTFIACNVYQIHEIRSSLVSALAEFLQPYEDPTDPRSLASMMFPEYRARMFHELTKVILSHTTFTLAYEFGKVQVDDTRTTLSAFLEGQATRRENAMRRYKDHTNITPTTLPYYLKLPINTTQALLRLVSEPVYHVVLPAMSAGVLTPIAVYSYDQAKLHKEFSYTVLTDWQVWSKPADYRASSKFSKMFDPDRHRRLASSVDLERMVFNHQWLTSYAQSKGFYAHPKTLIDHALHVPEALEDLLLLQKGYDMPIHRRLHWDVIDQHAEKFYPDFKRDKDHYKVSPPTFVKDIWGTTYAIKVKVLLAPQQSPSPLEGVRTNKDGAVTSLNGLNDLLNLTDIRGEIYFAMKATLVPKDKVVDEESQTLLQRPKRKKGRPKLLQSTRRTPPKPKPKTKTTQKEADTTPTHAPWLDT